MTSHFFIKENPFSIFIYFGCEINFVGNTSLFLQRYFFMGPALYIIEALNDYNQIYLLLELVIAGRQYLEYNT